MKFSAKSLKAFSLSALLYSGLDIRDLERLEYELPDDPQLKLSLAQHYWCSGQRGLAIERWKWLKNQDLLQWVEKRDYKALSRALACQP
jgi:thioredoxin-like negative regulator of GroEL